LIVQEIPFSSGVVPPNAGSEANLWLEDSEAPLQSGEPFWTRGCSAKVSTTQEKKMPKMKTNRGAAKRFKVTGKGKITYSKSYANHILTKKTTKRKRGLRKSGIIDKTNRAMVKRLIPYA
jgi:large subunit ribosomal protein L35